MKILRNMVIVGLIGFAVLSIAMDFDTQSEAWQAKPLKEKLEIVEREKEAALNRFRSKVGKQDISPEEVAQEAATATNLDKLENILLIEQSREKIQELEAGLERVREQARTKKRSWFSSSSSSSSSRDALRSYGTLEGESSILYPSSKATKEEISQAERKIELMLDKERDNLKKLETQE
jgi:hypothetical protein